ncbi:MAG TPA: hypothetical protein ENI23_08975 [bacterium]|nr:hypothetical protein [bacterium]
MVSQDTNQDKLLEGKREVKVKQGFFRCLHCGSDVERLYPQVYNVNAQTLKKLIEIKTKDSNFRIITETQVHPKIFVKLDDVTLRPISGTCYNVNLDVCFSCIDKVGWRHKFMTKQRNRLYGAKPL